MTTGGGQAGVAGLFDAELVSVRWVITAAMSEREGTVSEAIYNVIDRFPFEASSDMPSLSAQGSSDQA